MEHAAGYDPRLRLIIEPSPWLLFAAVMRILAFEIPEVAIIPNVLAEAATLLAFISASGRLIEILGGSTPLAGLDFGAQLGFIRWADAKLAAALLTASGLVAVVGYALQSRYLVLTSPHLLFGFDGIAFDQFTTIGRLWSGLLAAATLLVIVERAAGRPTSVKHIAAQLCRRWRYVLIGTMCVGVFMIAFTGMQGAARSAVLSLMVGDLPGPVKNLIFLGFVFVFACARLLVTLAILCLALRKSYQGEAPRAA